MPDPRDAQEYLAELMGSWERERYDDDEDTADTRYRGWVEVTHLRRALMAKENCP